MEQKMSVNTNKPQANPDTTADGTGTLRERNMSKIATDLRDMARRNSAAFAAGAAVAGFALARFLQATARR